MKKSILFLALIASLNSVAQINNSYTGKAKTFVDNFWKLADDIKKVGTEESNGKAPAFKTLLDRAKVQLKYVKTKDPAYDITAMEQFLKPYEDGVTAAFAEKEDAFREKLKQEDKDGDGLASLFIGEKITQVNATGNADTDLAKHKELINAYNGKVEKVIASSPMELESVNNYMQNQVKPTKERIIRLEADINKAVDLGCLYDYYALAGLEACWNAANRMLKKVAGCKEVKHQASEALQRIGTEEQLKSKIAVKQRELLKSRKMPAAVKKDAALEQIFKIQFGKILANYEKYKDETIIKVNIIQTNWTIIRNQYTGVIVGRGISAAIATKKADGRYFVYDFANYIEDYQGGNYVAGKCDNGFKWPQEILPENINK